MNAPKARLTAQGQITIPADVRKKLGIGPGSTVEFVEDESGAFTIKKSGLYTFEDIHKTLFPNGPPKYIENPRNEGVRAYVRKKYGRNRH